VNQVQAFARAPLGLPIIYQFKDGREGDPSPQTLKGGETERLASPILLRALRTGPNAFHGIALHLKNTFHTREHLVPGQLKVGHQAVSHQLSAADLESIKSQANLPPALKDLEKDVLASFLAWFAQ
jgi:CRISPR/Cas system CMR-associated protein Cmr1 (group 7 of RAMP superfamily)